MLDLRPGQWTEEELDLIRGGVCPWVTGYGLPWIEHCRADRDDPDSPWCAEHREELDA